MYGAQTTARQSTYACVPTLFEILIRTLKMIMSSHNKQATTVSVLLPVYNGESYLHEAMDSLLAQTFKDFELLALDDGSTDGSLEILREYEAKDNRVRIISRENKGLVHTLNELIGEASGVYLARMDADDICLPGRFEEQIEFLDSHPDHVVVGGWIETMNAQGQSIGIIEVAEGHKEIDGNNLDGHTSILHPVAMIRKVAMISVEGYKQEYEHAEDLDLWLRLAEIGDLSNIQKVLLRYRLHDNSISAMKAESQQQASKRTCEQAWHRRGINGQYKANEHWRPSSDTASRHAFALQYGWISWSNGNRATWWTYVKQALSLKPLSVYSWKLLIFGLLRRPTR